MRCCPEFGSDPISWHGRCENHQTSMPDPERILYFAYGSNMAPQRLQARVPSATVVGVAVLRGYQLKFHKSGKDGSAKCDASRSDSMEHEMHGVLYSMLKSELPVLDGF